MPLDAAPVSDDQLQAAYERMREPGWPQWSELLRANLLYQRVRATVNRRTHAAPPTVHTSAQPPAPRVPVPHHPPTFDAKRAAAGERPDDE